MRWSRGVVVLSVATLAAAGLLAVGAPAAVAAASGDTTLVVQSFSIAENPSASYNQRTVTTMCPAGTRALSGGAAPTAPLNSNTFDNYRMFYSAPVDASGGPTTASTGGVPAGWTVTVAVITIVADPEPWKAFVVCSASSDAVMVTSQPSPPPSGPFVVSVQCPAGSRAVGGGMGQITTASPIPPDVAGPIVFESGPVTATGTVSDMLNGAVPTGWRISAENSSGYGNRFVAVCSATLEATVRVAEFTVPASDSAGAGGSAACPSGARATGGGLAVNAAHDPDDRFQFQAPVPALTGLPALATGAAPRNWFASGSGNNSAPRTYRVYAVCAAEPDTTPPQTTITKGPDKKTFSTKAKFKFSSEAGATFTCSLDGKRAKACSSPFKVKNLKPGKHKVKVTAKDTAGNVETKPATYKWKVLEKPTGGGCTGECRIGP